VPDSGLDVLHEAVFAALARGARIRLVTGDYLDITQAAALRRLLDWANASTAREDRSGMLQVRVVEVDAAAVVSFHPKSWRFEATASARLSSAAGAERPPAGGARRPGRDAARRPPSRARCDVDRLGTTWLAAYDVALTAKDTTPRVLFVSHRFELLEQAAETFRRMSPRRPHRLVLRRSRGRGGGHRLRLGAESRPPGAARTPSRREASASIPHARFVERCLREWGVRVVSVHSEPDSADRDEALVRLPRGELDAVCSVDLFNEGVDVPALDRVVMLQEEVRDHVRAAANHERSRRRQRALDGAYEAIAGALGWTA
jgi:hypothetical protein